jgi:hypothetical protein
MSYVVDGGVEIRLDDDEREKLGNDFKTWAESVEDARRRRMHEVWVRALHNYEGKEPVKQFPWPMASNAVLPKTRIDVDAIAARIYNASTANDPAHLILPGARGNVIEDVSVELWARWWQNISQWIEQTKLDYKDLQRELAWTLTLYGDAFLYLPWEKAETTDVELNLDTGKVDRTRRTLWDGIRPQVFHPKDVYVNVWEKDVQSARRVGLRWDLDLPGIEERAAQGIYGEKQADELKELLQGQEDREKSKKLKALIGPYYREYGGNYYNPDEFDKALRGKEGVEEESQPHALRMLKVFSRADLDGDGVPEELVFDVERETGSVPYARYANLMHRERPIVQYSYMKRPQSIYGVGVPELLFNIQKILNTTMRDVLDNNKIRNTKIFLAKKGGPIEENAKVYPSRMLFVNDVTTDFAAVDLGSGSLNTSVQDIGMLTDWGDKLTGISDPELGRERKSRTPATTTMALLEQSAKRMDSVIDLKKNSDKKSHRQVLMMSFQNGDVDELARVAAIEEGEEEKFKLAFAAVSPEDMRKHLHIDAKVSSAALNKSVMQQKVLVVFQQVDQYYQRMQQLAQLMAGGQLDPSFQGLIEAMANGYHRLMSQFLDTSDMKDQEKDVNPDLTELIKGVTTVEVNGEETGNAERSNPAQQAAGLATAGAGNEFAAQAPVSKPQPGLGRPPGPTPGS